MSTLYDVLQSRPQDERIVGTHDGWATAGLILRTAHALRHGAFARARGEVVSLLIAGPQQFLTNLVALDGWAAGILQSDVRVDPVLLHGFEEAAGARLRVQDGTVTAKLAPGLTAEPGSVTRWIVATSGTTGTPKLIPHTFASLTRTVKPPSAVSAALRWGLLYDAGRFAGLQVLLQAVIGGSAVIVPKDCRDLHAAIGLLRSLGCNALSATPSLWRLLAILGFLDQLELKVVTLGGEPADQRILDVLKARFPVATIRHIYASTECGVGFSVGDGLAGFPATFIDHPPCGIAVRVRDGDGMLLVNSDASNLQPGQAGYESEAWMPTGDLVERRGDRYYFLGRANGSINVGGQKVHPSTVEQVILAVPGVQAVRVFARPNAILGALVAAEIVPDAPHDGDRLRELVLAACRQSLQRHEVPAVVRFTDHLTLTETGKIPR